MCPLYDCDPDIQYYNSQCSVNLSSCNYYLEDLFNKKLSQLDIADNAFSMVHTNIRSIPRNLSKFDHYLESLNHKFSIIGVSESWLKDSTANRYGLAGYQAEHRF